MKKLTLQLPAEVTKSYLQHFSPEAHRIPESSEPAENTNGPIHYPAFTLDANLLARGEFKVFSPFWLLTNGEKDILSEFDNDGNLIRVYNVDESVLKMIKILESQGNSSDKKTAIADIPALNLKFVWSGQQVRLPMDEDTFMLLGASLHGFRKNVSYNLSAFLDLAKNAMLKIQAATPSTIGS